MLFSPVRELIRVCREQEVDQVFVDGAHAIGSVRVDVKEIGADFYVSHLYKWFFSPPSVASLYCKKSNPVTCITLWFRKIRESIEGGIEGIMRRNHDGVVKMGTMLAETWGTILGSPLEMCTSLIVVGLPSKLYELLQW
ncbi:Pyridoxal phosphate-dependent transferase, major domain [Sesbania bispinosa]|nr:Pyridoxal phosphate-dependent transferase, major domain [Sesbania bispinosa]